MIFMKKVSSCEIKENFGLRRFRSKKRKRELQESSKNKLECQLGNKTNVKTETNKFSSNIDVGQCFELKYSYEVMLNEIFHQFMFPTINFGQETRKLNKGFVLFFKKVPGLKHSSL